MDLPEPALRHIESDAIAWLTTVTGSGAPAPNPVWFVYDGGYLVVFSSPTSVRVRNIPSRPEVALHFNSDQGGNDIVILNGVASLHTERAPSAVPAYLAKYERTIENGLGMTVADFDATYSTEIRIRPTRVRLMP